ncbi:hypothetical protein PIB30_038465 [Stylosanthes scabra]|uniref:Uncharacterized protein n=1 Tax=Stylosanthes scabra TaxID=79078 RepID=A0ABU6ZCR8_9FABA|nr:hypothetical protein [Stylosanthes scabra]
MAQYIKVQQSTLKPTPSSPNSKTDLFPPTRTRTDLQYEDVGIFPQDMQIQCVYPRWKALRAQRAPPTLEGAKLPPLLKNWVISSPYKYRQFPQALTPGGLTKGAHWT